MDDRSPAEGTWLEVAQEAGGMVVAKVAALPEERLAEVRELYRLLDPALPAVERDTVDAALAAAGVTVFAAVARDGRVAGLVTLIVVPTFTRTRAWAEDLVVHPEFRGRGVGKALMAACAEGAARAGAGTIDGTVDPSRRAALALYLKAGWEVSRSLPVQLAFEARPARSRSAGTNR
jgi:GNAT superfamily N-acetyltransferase